MKYPKIETLYPRDEETHHVNVGELRLPEFGLVKHWHVTEKVDGTNIRVRLTSACQGACSDCGSTGGCIVSPSILFSGRTDGVQIPPFLLEELGRIFPPGRFTGVFDEDVGEVWLFGEGYGARIQKGGGDYREGVSFRLFDVVVLGADDRPWWLRWEDVEDVARKLGVKTVPPLGYFSLEEVTGMVKTSILSPVSEEENAGSTYRLAEGVVARTEPPLFDRRGNRVVWKLKTKDFPREES